MDHYVTSVRRAEKAKKRLPGDGLVRLEAIDWENVPEPTRSSAPGEVFDYAWASALLDEVLAEVKGECHETGMAAHWELFRAKILQPIKNNTEAPPLAYLCKEHGISTKKKASNMLITVKRRFGAVLKRHLQQFVDSDAEIGMEIQDLGRILSRGSAAS